MAEDQIATLFQEVDTSNDGKVSLKELGRMFKSLGIKLSVKDVRSIIYKFDTDGSRDIDLEEFRELIADVLSANTQYEEAYEAFKVFDTNGDNTITRDEVKNACMNLGTKMTEADIDELIAKMDADGNGIIHFDEFAKAYALGV